MPIPKRPKQKVVLSRKVKPVNKLSDYNNGWHEGYSAGYNDALADSIERMQQIKKKMFPERKE